MQADAASDDVSDDTTALEKWLARVPRVPLMYPRVVLALFACVALATPLGLTKLHLDASADSLLMESDRQLEFYRDIRRRYGDDDYLLVAYRPEAPLLDQSSLDVVAELDAQISALPHVQRVVSILDVPLIYAADADTGNLPEHFPTLEEAGREAAKNEFTNNPFYTDRLVSGDLTTTALRIDLEPDPELTDLIEQRAAVPEDAADRERRRARLDDRIERARRAAIADQRETIAAVREILGEVAPNETTYLGGVPMIVVDMLRFISSDLVVFGSAIALFALVTLGIFFRRPRWVLVPIVCCGATALFLAAIIGALGWSITVVSSNFLPMLLIVALSLSIHVIVQIRDRRAEERSGDYAEAVEAGAGYAFAPCLYTVVTTAVAFGSLLVSDIRPVVDLGWFMVIGLGIALAIIFSVLPAVLIMLEPGADPIARRPGQGVLKRVAEIVSGRPRLVLALGAAVALVCAAGIPRIEVENRFIDNFRPDTEIHRGMTLIDRNLGGTTPLDVIIDAPADFTAPASEEPGGPVDDLLRDELSAPPENFWFRQAQLGTAAELQDFLSGHAMVGKALSIASTAQLVRDLNGGQLPPDFQLAVLRKQAPAELAEQAFDPFLGQRGNQARFAARIVESAPDLDRAQLLDDIQRFIDDHVADAVGEVRLTGMLVLYNNMLQSLYRSQAMTLGAVFAAVLAVFMVVFRSPGLALVAMIPNLFACVAVIGIMGWLQVPLNMMTITVAAVSVGIAVDDTIHYLHQLRYTVAADTKGSTSLEEAISRCHQGVGKAVLYTSVVIAGGFSLLTASNFVPTTHFGLLTGVAMAVALLADLVLLPAALLIFRPRAVTPNEHRA